MGRLLDQVLAVTASSISAMKEGIDLRCPEGTVLLFTPAEILSISPPHLFFQEITLGTSYSAGPYETGQALDLLRSGRIRAEHVITHRFALCDAAQAFQLVAKPGHALKAVILAG